MACSIVYLEMDIRGTVSIFNTIQRGELLPDFGADGVCSWVCRFMRTNIISASFLMLECIRLTYR